jgi:predicted transcriptional regulator
MTIINIILGIIATIGLIIYLKYFIPLRPKESGFEYVYVNEDGTVSELDEEDVEYLKTEFSPADGARPYIKNQYKELTADRKMSGFILRNRVPKKIEIKALKKTQDKRTISWIFLAISMASDKEPADFNSISMIADGINHAIPTHKEMQTSISWLSEKGLISKVGNKYTLTSKGKDDFKIASKGTNTLLNIWDNMEQKIINYA